MIQDGLIEENAFMAIGDYSRDLDKVTCEETKHLWSFLEDFKRLAVKSGKLYFPSTSEKFFAKP